MFGFPIDKNDNSKTPVKMITSIGTLEKWENTKSLTMYFLTLILLFCRDIELKPFVDVSFYFRFNLYPDDGWGEDQTEN